MLASERTLDSVDKVHKMMKDLVGQLHSDVQVMTDPHARAIFEAAEESISKLIRAIGDFEKKQEPGYSGT